MVCLPDPLVPCINHLQLPLTHSITSSASSPCSPHSSCPGCLSKRCNSSRCSVSAHQRCQSSGGLRRRSSGAACVWTAPSARATWWCLWPRSRTSCYRTTPLCPGTAASSPWRWGGQGGWAQGFALRARRERRRGGVGVGRLHWQLNPLASSTCMLQPSCSPCCHTTPLCPGTAASGPWKKGVEVTNSTFLAACSHLCSVTHEVRRSISSS